MNYSNLGYGWSSMSVNPQEYQAEPVGSLMYTPLETVFRDTMIREGKTVTAYTSGAEFRAFMRRNDDGNGFEDRITLFYPTNAPVVQGSLVSYGNKVYILINRETEENDCYYKSSGLACNGIINLNDGSIGGIICYAYNMGGSMVDENQIISVIDGEMEFITESNSLSRSLTIGKTFNEFGRTFKINNTYYKDGILHLVTEVTTSQAPTIQKEIIIDGLTDTNYDVGETVQLEATLYYNHSVTVGTVTWESTNTNVATIDGTGLVTFIGSGTVAFKAYWVEQDVQNTTNTVASGTTQEVYTATISGRTSIMMGFERTYTAILTDGSGNEVEGTWEWSFEFKYPNIVTLAPDGNKVEVYIEDYDDALEEIITIIAHETTKDVSASIEAEITYF